MSPSLPTSLPAFAWLAAGCGGGPAREKEPVPDSPLTPPPSKPLIGRERGRLAGVHPSGGFAPRSGGPAREKVPRPRFPPNATPPSEPLSGRERGEGSQVSPPSPPLPPSGLLPVWRWGCGVGGPSRGKGAGPPPIPPNASLRGGSQVCPRVGLITRTAGDWQGTGGKAAESRAPWRRLRLTSVRFRGAPRYGTSRCPPFTNSPRPATRKGTRESRGICLQWYRGFTCPFLLRGRPREAGRTRVMTREGVRPVPGGKPLFFATNPCPIRGKTRCTE